MFLEPYVIGISGGTGSGKTRLAGRISQHFPTQTTIIEQDWYYRDRSHVDAANAGLLNFDEPDAIEHGLLVDHLGKLKAGQTVFAPQYEYLGHKRTAETLRLESKPLLVLEGLFVFHYQELRDLIDIKIFIDVDIEERRRRRVRRDEQERGYSREEIERYWTLRVAPMHAKFVEPAASLADFVWDPAADTAYESRFFADLRKRIGTDGNRSP